MKKKLLPWLVIGAAGLAAAWWLLTRKSYLDRLAVLTDATDVAKLAAEVIKAHNAGAMSDADFTVFRQAAHKRGYGIAYTKEWLSETPGEGAANTIIPGESTYGLSYLNASFADAQTQYQNGTIIAPEWQKIQQQYATLKTGHMDVNNWANL